MNHSSPGPWLAIALMISSQASAQDSLARELPRIKPLEPAAALRSFRVHPGFHLEQVAAEPMVINPVSTCYDADGRLYVVEMLGYPYPEKVPTGRVARLEDRDGDGRFDTRTVFLEGLEWPTGIVPYDDGVFVAVAPDLVYAKDTSGDGVADVKKVLFTGFKTENVQGLFNGLLWGPDGWIYGVTSSNGGEIKNLVRPGRNRCRFAVGIFGSGPMGRRSRRSPGAASSAIASTTGGTGLHAATAIISARS